MTSNNKITPEKQRELNDKLLVAAEKGSVEEVTRLILEGAEVDFRDKNGNTPLHKAAYKGYLDVVKNLVENGAYFNLRNGGGKRPLEIAEESAHIKVKAFLEKIERLFDELSGYRLTESDLQKTQSLISENKDYLNIRDYLGQTPLHKAAWGNNLTIVRKLIEKGAEVNSKDNKGETPLHKAAYKGYLDVVKNLVENGAYFNLNNGEGKTPLKFAQENSHTKVKDFLEKIEKLFGELRKDELTESALQEIQNLINENKSYLNARDHFGNTPLHYATEKSHLNSVIKLIKEGANIDIKNNDGYTPLAKFIEKLIGETSSALKKDIEFKASIKGDRGEQGLQGERGKQGSQGAPGKDANPETVAEKLKDDQTFIQSVKGEPGPEGKQGAPGKDANPETVAEKLKGDKIFIQSVKGDNGTWSDKGPIGYKGLQDEKVLESKPGKDGNMSFKITKDKSYGEISSAKIVDGENYDVGILSDIGYFFQGDELYIRNHLTDKNIRVPQEFYFLKAIHDSSGRLKFALCNSSGNLLYEYKKYDSEYVQLPKFVEVSHLSLEKGEVLNRCHQYDTWGPVLQLKKNPSGEVEVCEITQEEKKIGKLIDEFVYYKGDKLHHKNYHNPAENECCYGEGLYVNIRNNMATKGNGSDNNYSTVNLEQSFDIQEPFLWMIGQC